MKTPTVAALALLVLFDGGRATVLLMSLEILLAYDSTAGTTHTHVTGLVLQREVLLQLPVVHFYAKELQGEN
jgi:hypothetical protein